MFFVVVCDIHRRSFLPFSHLIIHPIQEMIWILTTIPSLIRRLQWWIAVLLLFEGRQRVAPFYHPSIHQISTLEKAKLCHRPTLSSLVSTSFRQIVCGGGLPRDLRHGKQQVAPFYHLYQLSHSKDFWLPCSPSPDFLTPKMTELRQLLQEDSSLASTSLWLFLHLNLIAFFVAIPSELTVELKWLMLNKHKRWFHSSCVQFPLEDVSKLVFGCRCTKIWIFGSK